MRYVQGKIRTLLAQQSGQIQLLIVAPILTLFFLSLVVRTANSAIDPSLEKKKVNHQLKQRLLEVREMELNRFAERENQGQKQDPRPESWVLAKEKIEYVKPQAVQALISATEQKSKHQLSSWELAQRNFDFSLFTYKAPNKADEKKAQLVKVDGTEEVKKAIAATQLKKSSQAPVVTAALAPVPLPVPAPTKKEETLLPPPSRVVHTIKKQETLEIILKRIGVPAKEAARWIATAKTSGAFRTLRPKQTIELNFVEDSFTLQSVVYEIEADTRAILERNAKDHVKFRLEELPLESVLLVVGGRIEANLTKTLRKSGLPARITEGVAKLAWDIDLSSLRKGDSFKVLVEAVRKGEKIVTYKTLLAAEVSSEDILYSAFSIPEERLARKKKIEEEQYRGEGLSIESEGEKFLRFPLEFTRISSTFSGARFHPILRRSRPHKGIDFAAPRGTPVRSVASGIVTFAGRQSGYGNMVKIDHPGPYETGYAHLQRYAEGVTEGASVGRGQVVGYVGSTGLATGPHLHFELYKDGEFVNPLSEAGIVTASLVEEEEEEPVAVNPVIEEKKKRLSEQLAALEIAGKQLSSLVIPLPRAGKVNGVAATRAGRRAAAR